MCEVLKGGVLAGVTTILALLVCSVLVSMGMVPVGAMYGAVLAVCVLGGLTGPRSALVSMTMVFSSTLQMVPTIPPMVVITSPTFRESRRFWASFFRLFSGYWLYAS